MKKIITTIFVILMGVNVFAQSRMSYQAVARGSNNELMTSSPIGMKITIVQGSVSGTPVYSETQSALTNLNGLFTVAIGDGNATLGNFNTIDWSNGPYFIKTETDLTGGTNYTISGITELMSVPYAKYAETSGTQGVLSVNGVQHVNGNITLVKSDIGLENVDNTSDADKPVSTAVQAALDQKADASSPVFTGVPTVPTAAPATNTTQIATTEFVTNAVTAAATPDATASIKGRVALGGDLAGTGTTAEAPVITADAVTTVKIADANVTYEKIQNVSTSGKVLGRMSIGAGTVEELSTTGTGDVVMSDSPTFTGLPMAPTPSPGSNSNQVSTTNFVRTMISAAEIKETPSGLGITLDDTYAGKIVTTQWGGQPTFPDNLANGFSCTIINYSNSPFTTNALSTAFFFTETTGWNGGIGATTITIKSGGSVRLNVIDVNGVKGYFVTGDLQ